MWGGTARTHTKTGKRCAWLTGRTPSGSLPFGGRGPVGGRLGANSPHRSKEGNEVSRRSPHGRGDGPRHYIGRPRKSSHTTQRGRPRREVGRELSTLTTSRNAADLRRRSDSPKNLCVQIRGARRNLRACLICSSSAPGPGRSEYKLTVPAAWLMRGVLPFARKCADQCPGAADRSKLE